MCFSLCTKYTNEIQQHLNLSFAIQKRTRCICLQYLLIINASLRSRKIIAFPSHTHTGRNNGDLESVVITQHTLFRFKRTSCLMQDGQLFCEEKKIDKK